MKHIVQGLVVIGLLVNSQLVWAEGAHDHGAHEHGAESAEQPVASADAPQEDTLTGEVVDVFCYLDHGEEGLGKKHASCAKKCIKNGLPVAIKVGDQLYLASLADHEPANALLADYAAQQVTVHGKVMERDGQKFIAVSHVE